MAVSDHCCIVPCIFLFVMPRQMRVVCLDLDERGTDESEVTKVVLSSLLQLSHAITFLQDDYLLELWHVYSLDSFWTQLQQFHAPIFADNRRDRVIDPDMVIVSKHGGPTKGMGLSCWRQIRDCTPVSVWLTCNTPLQLKHSRGHYVLVPKVQVVPILDVVSVIPDLLKVMCQRDISNVRHLRLDKLRVLQ